MVFDIGRVVWNHRRPYHLIYRRWAKMLGISYPRFWSKFLAVYKLFTTNQLTIKDWLLTFDPKINPQSFYQVIQNQLADYQKFSKYFLPHVLDLAVSLKSHYSVGCLANIENFYHPYHQKYIYPHFNFSVISCQVGLRKPDPAVYQEIFKHVDCQPSEVVFIDDKLENIPPAQALGLHTILYQNYQQLVNDLKIISPSILQGRG